MGALEKLTFGSDGLVPTIVQDAASNEVLMLAYMNEEALQRTISTGRTHFWSRSRSCLWRKGETSGNTQAVVDVRLDCDGDALLVLVQQRGVPCHTGARSCFHRTLVANRLRERECHAVDCSPTVLQELFEIIRQRRETQQAGSYTSQLFSEGQEAILRKVGEEGLEVIMASMNGEPMEIVHEISDLVYHLFVLLGFHGLRPEAVYEELHRRRSAK